MSVDIAMLERAEWLIATLQTTVRKNEVHPGDILELCAIAKELIDADTAAIREGRA